jgi:hypothetical protein
MVFAMRTITIVILYFSYWNSTAYCQRNLVDVPTSEIVEQKAFFFQEQINISNRQFITSTILTFGPVKTFEVGLMLNQLTFNTRPHKQVITIDPETPEYNPDFFLTAQKGFEVTDWLTLGLGTRIGLNAAPSFTKTSLVDFTFANAQFSLPQSETMFIAGLYYGNKQYEGEGNNFGLMLGTQINIVKDKVDFIADFTSGHNTTSVMNIGPQISLGKDWQVATAAQLPAPGSHNDYGLVIQLAKN